MAADGFDYVIVGSGPAGCALASRLTEDPGTRVVLLEAGGPDRKLELHVPAAFSKLFQTAHDWNFRTTPQARLRGRQLYWPRGKVLGGSTSINAQMYLRGHPADYDRWEQLGNPGWGSGEALRLFRKIEAYPGGEDALHGRTGPLRIEHLRDPNPATRAFLRAAVEIGIPANDDVNGRVEDGVAMTRVTQRRGRRWSAADAYLRPALRRANLTLRTGVHATRVVLEGGRAVGVEIEHGGERQVVRARREVILAAGAVGSPHLLMLSGIGPRDHLRSVGVEVVQHLPGVGQHLLDHLVAGVIVAARRPVSLVKAESLGNLLRFLLFRRGMLTSNVGEATAFVRTRPDLPAPDLELIFAPVPFANHGLEPPTRHGFTIGTILLQPRSVGTIRLRSASPLEPPEIEPGYLTDPEGEDLRVLRHGVKLARRILATRAFAELAGEELEPGAGATSDADIDAGIRRLAETLYHPVGTCRMGVDELAVVDPELRVHGIERLRVVDASVMPTIIRGHTMAPTYLVAERAAELIRAGAGRGERVPGWTPAAAPEATGYAASP